MKEDKNRVKGLGAFLGQYSRDNELKMDRSKIVGSSDVGSIMGVNPYCTAYKLWCLKTGFLKEEFTTKQKERMAIGKMMEDFIAHLYVELNGYCGITQRDVNYCSGNYRAQVDFLINGGTIIEIKNIDRFYDSYKDEDDNLKIPEYYKYQMYWQMYLSGHRNAKLVVYNNQEQQLYSFDCPYPLQSIIDDMLSKVNNFIVALETNNPTLLGNLLSSDYDIVKSIDSNIDVFPISNAIIKLKNDIIKLKELEESVEQQKSYIKEYMGENDTLVDGKSNNKVIATYKSQVTKRLDSDKLKEQFKDVYEQCAKEVKSRVFKLK